MTGSDTHRCRAQAYGVERSSYQAKCGTKGYPSPILGSARDALSAPGTGGVGSLGTPRGGHLMISPLCICRRCGRDGRRGRCRKAGTQGQERDRGGYTVSGYVSQVWEEVWEVSGADARRRRRDDSRLLGSILWRERASCWSAVVARCGAGRWPAARRRRVRVLGRGASVSLQMVGLGATRPCVLDGRREPQMLAAWRRPPRGAPTGPRCPGRIQDVLRTAIRGRGHVLRSRSRAAALRRARPPRRREGLFLCVEREERFCFRATCLIDRWEDGG